MCQQSMRCCLYCRNDYWTDCDAFVVCHQLGYPGYAQKLLNIKTIVKLIISGCGYEFSCCCILKFQNDISTSTTLILMLQYEHYAHTGCTVIVLILVRMSLIIIPLFLHSVSIILFHVRNFSFKSTYNKTRKLL